MKKYFRDNQWPWYALSALCILLGCLLLFRGRQGCADVARVNIQLAQLDRSLNACCRCATTPIGVVTPVDPRSPVVDPDEIVGIIDEDVYNEEIDGRREEAGGETGELVVTLSWNTTDDLDLSVVEPGGYNIHHRQRDSPNGGRLDVDENYRNQTTTPIENVFWSDAPAGRYKVNVALYQRKQSSPGTAIPITIQISRNGQKELKRYNVNGESNRIVKSIYFNYP